MGPGRGRFLACACFLTDNLFVAQDGLHPAILGIPSSCAGSMDRLKKKCREERELGSPPRERRAPISQNYRPKKTPRTLYNLQDSFLAPQFVETVKYCTSSGADLQGLLSHVESISDKEFHRLLYSLRNSPSRSYRGAENFEQSGDVKGEAPTAMK
uniref:Uncharacterized protein n=1 Tax=Sphaerodactylus townsendi TaxID=933632 RepID=A0ACB8FZA5_9SAUR